MLRATGVRAVSVGIWICFLLTACGRDAPDAAAVALESAPSQIPLGQLGSAVVPGYYLLDLTILPDADGFSGVVRIDVDVREPSRVLWLHGKSLAVAQAWLETGAGRIAAEYAEVDPTGVARLDLAAAPPVGPAQLHIHYTAPFDRSLEGLYKVTDRGDDYAFTQFQATSARLAFPSFDEPLFKTPFEIHITARPEHTVITATAEVAAEPTATGLVRRSFAVTPPLPTYLIAFAVGPLDVVEWAPVPPNAVRDWPLPLRGIAARGKGQRMAFALEHTAAIVAALEAYFDYPMPYPKLDIIAVPDFAAGAMENVGAITYREPFLLLGPAPTVAEQRRYASIHAHELAHQWFGNLVTPKWWDDIWLNESFATWMAAKTAGEVFPDFGFGAESLGRTLGVMDADGLASARQIRQPVHTNHDIADAFDGITYTKGGAVLAMLEGWLGEGAVRAGVRLHMRRFEHGVADVDDFLESMAQGSGEPELLAVFRSFLFQPGVPLLQVALDCEAAQPALDLRQSRYLPLGSVGQREQIWQLPVCVRYPSSAGATARHCALVTSTPARLPLPTRDCPAWLMPNADGFGYYRIALDPPGWEALFTHFDALNGPEARVLLASLSAAFRSGDLAVETLFAAMARLASHPDREVATAPLRDLYYVHQRLARTPAARAGLEARVREFYGPRQRELGLAEREDDTADDALLRVALVDAVANLGRDPALRERLTRAAQAYLKTPAAAPEGIDAGIIGTLLQVAVDDAGAGFAAGLLETLLLADDATFRSRALTALGSAADPDLGVALRDLLGDPRLRDNEASGLAFLQAGNEHQRDAIWAWIQEDGNRDRLLARIPSWRKGSIVRIGAGGCDAARAEAVAAWFEPQADQLEGGPRALAQTVESIRLCAALVAAQAAAVTAYLAD